MIPLFSSLTFDNVEPRWAWLWIVLGIGGAAVLFFTYWGIFQRSERRLTWLLMALRGAGLLALFLALARPTWTSENDVVDAGRVAIVLDNSISMSHRDDSNRPRYDRAREALQKLKKGFEEDKTRHRMDVDLFDITGMPLEGKAPDRPLVEQTDLRRALQETIAKLRSRPLAGVVLISDGMDNTRREKDLDEGDFPEFANLPFAIHTIGFRENPEKAGLDLAVGKPLVPERAMVNNDIAVKVPVTKSGGPHLEATVSLKRGRETIVAERVTFAAGDGDKVVTLKMTPREAGNFVYTAAVAAEGAAETVLVNNSSYFPVQVDKEKIQVVYLEGFLRFEFKFLKKHLEDDPDVLLTPLVRVDNPENKQLKRDRLTPEFLKNKHVVLVGDMEADYLSQPEYQALVGWLEEKGHHALLLLGGYNTFGPKGLAGTPLADVLPVVFSREPPFQSEEPFQMELSPEGLRHPIFEVTSDRVKDEAGWSKAPPLAGCSLVLRAKPSAEVLAVNSNPNLTVDGKKAIVVATQRFGDGRTMVLTADTTWRWSRFARIQGQPDTLYGRFWSQTIRWLSGRSVEEQRPLMAVSTDKPSYGVGKPVSVRVKRQPRPDLPLNQTVVGAEIVGLGGKSLPVDMKAASQDPDLFTGSFYPSAGGQYEVAATLKDGGNLMANQASEFLVHGSDLELADTKTNPLVLKAISHASGGQYFEIEEAENAVKAIPPKERRLKSVQRAEFWINPSLSLFFLAAVVSEWVIRRRNHLV